MPVNSSSPINKNTHWPREQGLSPGARSNPSRPGGAQSDSVPSLSPGQASGVGAGLTGGAGTQPRSSAVHSEGREPEPHAKADALRGAVDQHLLKHRMLHLRESDLPPTLAAIMRRE
jgi:hypothetical protein